MLLSWYRLAVLRSQAFILWLNPSGNVHVPPAPRHITRCDVIQMVFSKIGWQKLYCFIFIHLNNRVHGCLVCGKQIIQMYKNLRQTSSACGLQSRQKIEYNTHSRFIRHSILSKEHRNATYTPVILQSIWNAKTLVSLYVITQSSKVQASANAENQHKYLVRLLRLFPTVCCFLLHNCGS